VEGSSFVHDRVRPVLAELLALEEGDERRDSDRLFREVRRLAEPVVVGEGELTVEEAGDLLGSCAALLLAIVQPYAPAAPSDQQADLLTYALRLICPTHLLFDCDEDDHVADGLEDLDQELDHVEEMLERLRADAADPAIWAGLLITDVFDAAAICVIVGGTVVGMSAEDFREARRDGVDVALRRRRTGVASYEREGNPFTRLRWRYRSWRRERLLRRARRLVSPAERP
jgi:hypothetical protein